MLCLRHLEATFYVARTLIQCTLQHVENRVPAAMKVSNTYISNSVNSGHRLIAETTIFSKFEKINMYKQQQHTNKNIWGCVQYHSRNWWTALQQLNCMNQTDYTQQEMHFAI